METDKLLRTKIGKNNPSIIAMKDISEYLHTQNIQIVDEFGDVWVVTPTRMATKETRRLNVELGLHKINKYGSRMARNKKEYDKRNK